MERKTTVRNTEKRNTDFDCFHIGWLPKSHENVPWQVGMVDDQWPFSWHTALVEPLSN
jgi:hypothetical protein